MDNQDSNESPNNNTKKSSLGGLALSQARYMCNVIFSEHLERVAHNTEEHTFDVYIYPTADKRDIDKFKGNKFYRIFHVSQKPIKI